MVNINIVKRGEVWWADMGMPTGSEQGGIRPVIIIQNEQGNKNSGTVIVTMLTSKLKSKYIPTHLVIKSGLSKIPTDSMAMLEQVRTIDKSRLDTKICYLNKTVMDKIDEKINISFGLKEKPNYEYIQILLDEIQTAETNEYNSINAAEKMVSLFAKELATKLLIVYCSKYNIDYTLYLIKNKNKKVGC